MIAGRSSRHAARPKPPQTICADWRCASSLQSQRNSRDVTMARYQSRINHDLALFGRLNVRFIRRHFAKTIKRDERGFYYSNADKLSMWTAFRLRMTGLTYPLSIVAGPNAACCKRLPG